MSKTEEKKIDYNLIFKICLGVFVFINIIYLLNKISGWWGGSDLKEWFGVFANFSEGLLEDCTKQKSCGPISPNATKDECPEYCDYRSSGAVSCNADSTTGVPRPNDDDDYWKNKDYNETCFISKNKNVTCNWAEINKDKGCYYLHVDALCKVPDGRTVGKPNGIFGSAWSSPACLISWLLFLPVILLLLGGLGKLFMRIKANSDKEVKNIASTEGVDVIDVKKEQYDKVKEEMREQEEMYEMTEGEQGHPSKEFIQKMPNETADEKKARLRAQAQREVGREITARTTMSNFVTDKWRVQQNTDRANKAVEMYKSNDIKIINRTINKQKHLNEEEKRRAIEEAKERGPIEIK